jgi:hypothetical protein
MSAGPATLTASPLNRRQLARQASLIEGIELSGARQYLTQRIIWGRVVTAVKNIVMAATGWW